MSSPRTVFVVFLETTAKKQVEGVAAIRRIIGQAFPSFSSEILVVDNAITTPHEEKLEDGVTLIDGDNSCREFSGMDRGLNWLKRNRSLKTDSIILFVNDTFTADADVEDFYRLDGHQVTQDLDRNCLIGPICWSPLPLGLSGVATDHWVQTNLILCTYGVLQHITPLVLPFGDDELFSDDPATFFAPNGPLSTEYAHYLKRYLQGELNVTLCKWHSSNEFTADNFASFKLKAKAILCEHYLSAKARKCGFALVDVSGPRFPSKVMRVRIKAILYHTGAWRFVSRYRNRFCA
jgi:hypothetical protein